jgi:carboxymethylenebutenolidase
MSERSETVSYPAGARSVRAYVAVPASGRGPGVLALHEGWGFGEFIRDVCDRLAREGFVALAPDFFDGRSAATVDEARELVGRLTPERLAEDLEGAVHALLSHAAVDGPRVGAVGFCMGGHLALLAACTSRRVGAVVDFYGALPGIPLELPKLEASVLGLFAGDDEFIPAEAVEALRRDLRAAGKRAQLQVTPGVHHAYMNPLAPDRFDAAAAAEGWERMLAHLRAELA